MTCPSLLTCETYFKMSNVFFVSSLLKYIVAMMLLSTECLFHLQTIPEKNLNLGGQLRRE